MADQIEIKEEKKVENLETKPAVKVDDKSIEVKVETKVEPEVGDSVDDFLAVSNRVAKALPEVKKEEVKKDEKKEFEVKDEKVVDKKVDEGIKTKQEDDSTQRDYSGLEESEVPLFKKMGNESFKKLKPELLELRKKSKELSEKVSNLEKGAIPENYNLHPRGYTLTPEFEKAANTLMKAEVILNHWESQLDKIKKGDTDKYQEIHIDPKTGEFYLSAPLAVDGDTDTLINSYVRGAQVQLATKQADINNMSKSHKGSYDRAVAEIKDFEKQSFSNFEKLKDEDAKAMNLMIEDTVKKVLPPAFHNDPLATSFAKALITIQQLGAFVQQVQEGKIKLDVKEGEKKDEKKVEKKEIDEDQRKAGPTGSHLNGEGGGKSDEEITFDDFKKVMNRA